MSTILDTPLGDSLGLAELVVICLVIYMISDIEVRQGHWAMGLQSAHLVSHQYTKGRFIILVTQALDVCVTQHPSARIDRISILAFGRPLDQRW